jgi:hypothetical protein
LQDESHRLYRRGAAIYRAIGLPADEIGAHKKACHHLRWQALRVCMKLLQSYYTQRLLNCDERGQETTSTVTRPTPVLVRPMAHAAPVERSSTRPRMKGHGRDDSAMEA